MELRLLLNTKAKENYAFFDPDTSLHLTITDPSGVAPRISKSILRGLRSGRLIDMNNVVDLESGEFIKMETPMPEEDKGIPSDVMQEEEVKTEETPVEEVVPVEQPKKPARRKSTNKTDNTK